MLISKFNKLIRNKFLWAVFAILVSLSMIGFFAPQPRNTRENRDGLGTLFGEEVGRDEFVRARLFAQSFQPLRGGEELQRMVDEEAWRRLASLRYAERIGLRVSEAELVSSIQRDPSFLENGVFSMQRYQFLIQEQLGIPVEWFEEYMRQEILLGRLRGVLDTSLWVPASELEENAARFTDTYEVEYVLITTNKNLTVEDVTEEQANAAYTNAPDYFMVPEHRKVVYTTYPYENYTDLEEVTDRQIELRYEEDPDRFVDIDAETATVVTQQLDDVREEIREELAEEEAMAVASEMAMEMVDELSLQDAETGVSLERVANSIGMTVHTSDWFEADGDTPADISAGAAFNQSAFRLSLDDQGQSFSFGVPGTNAVYVLQLVDVAESYVPEFKDVKEEAFALAQELATEKALQERAEKVHTSIEAGLDQGGAFSNVVQDVGLAVTQIKPFSLQDADPRDIPFFGDLAPDLLPLQAGEITPPIDSIEGKVIAYVKTREPGTPEDRLVIKPDLAEMMASGVQNIHFRTWADQLLQTARGQ